MLTALAERRASQAESVNKRLLSLQQEISDTDDRLKRLYHSIEEGIVDVKDLGGRIADLVPPAVWPARRRAADRPGHCAGPTSPSVKVSHASLRLGIPMQAGAVRAAPSDIRGSLTHSGPFFTISGPFPSRARPADPVLLIAPLSVHGAEFQGCKFLQSGQPTDLMRRNFTSPGSVRRPTR
jgi:hypothetical protein